MKFLVPNYSCLQNPWLRGYRPQIPVLSVLCPQLNLLTPPPEKIPGYATGMKNGIDTRTQGGGGEELNPWGDSDRFYLNICKLSFLKGKIMYALTNHTARYGCPILTHESADRFERNFVTSYSSYATEVYPTVKRKGKAIPLQAWTGPEGSRRFTLPDFKTVGTWRW